MDKLEFKEGFKLLEYLYNLKEQYIKEAVVQTGGNLYAASKLLGVKSSTLRQYIRYRDWKTQGMYSLGDFVEEQRTKKKARREEDLKAHLLEVYKRG